MEAVTNSQIVPLKPPFLPPRPMSTIFFYCSAPVLRETGRSSFSLPPTLPLLLTPLAPLPPPRTERPSERDPRGQSRFVAVRPSPPPISFEEGVSPGWVGGMNKFPALPSPLTLLAPTRASSAKSPNITLQWLPLVTWSHSLSTYPNFF